MNVEVVCKFHVIAINKHNNVITYQVLINNNIVEIEGYRLLLT